MGKSSSPNTLATDLDRQKKRLKSGNTGSPKLILSSRKKRKTGSGLVSLRSSSPVIDLTDERNADDDEELPKELESPLKHVKSRSVRSERVTRSLNGAIAQITTHPALKKGHLSDDMKALPELFAGGEKVPDLGFSGNPSDLNLSPIRPNSGFPHVRPTTAPALHRSLSPTKKKSVAFSDNVQDDLHSSPCRMLDQLVTPRKSILKNFSSPADTKNAIPCLDLVQNEHLGIATEFWQPGTIVQLEPRSPELPRLVAKSLVALKNGDFERKFEVYASLNHVFKQNTVLTVYDVFSRQVPTPQDRESGLWKSEVRSGYTSENSSPRKSSPKKNATSSNGASPKKTADVTGTEATKFNSFADDELETIPRALVFFGYAQRDVQLLESRLFPHQHIKREHEGNEQEGNAGKRNINENPDGSLDDAFENKPETFNPFEARTLTQALKFMAHFLAIPLLSALLHAHTIRWCYMHCCELLMKPSLSKSLVSSYICIIKDFNFTVKQKKAIFDNVVPEHVLSTLLNMQSFLSLSLINEKFIAMRNLILHFPAVMARNFHHWFPGLVMNLCDLSFVLYYKVVATGITTLLEAARNFLDSADICKMTRSFLESSVTSERSWVTESMVSVELFNGQNTLNFVVETLNQLSNGGQYKYAMDIWVGVSLLLGNFQKWPYLTPWLKIHKACFNEKSMVAKETAISSWKVVVYKMCLEIAADFSAELPPNSPKKNAFDEKLRPKAKLLIHPFICISTSQLKNELVSAFHNCFLSVLYTLLNPQPKIGVRVIQALWDRILHPVLANLYFRKQASLYMQELGLDVFCRLIKPLPPANERHFNNLRCLSNDSIPLSQINSLSPKWVFLRFDKVLPILLVILALPHLPNESKITALTSFLSSIKSITKNEVQVSDNTFDIIDNLPQCFEALFSSSEISYEETFKLLVSINDTFGPPNLVSEDKNAYLIILRHCAGNTTPQQLNAILSMLCGAVGERKAFRFFSLLEKVERSINRPDILTFMSEILNQKRFAKFNNSDLVVLGKIFCRLDKNFNSIAKKVIQHIVLLKVAEFDEMVTRLNIVSWNIQIFNFYVILMHNAPYDHLTHATVSLIKKRADFPAVLQLLIDSEFDSEILAVKDVFVNHVLGEVEGHLWAYLKKHQNRQFVDSVLSECLHLGWDYAEIVQEQWDDFPLSKDKQCLPTVQNSCGSEDHPKVSFEIFDSIDDSADSGERRAEDKSKENEKQNTNGDSEEVSESSLENKKLLPKPDFKPHNSESHFSENHKDLGESLSESVDDSRSGSENLNQEDKQVCELRDSLENSSPEDSRIDHLPLQIFVNDQSTVDNSLEPESIADERLDGVITEGNLEIVSTNPEESRPELRIVGLLNLDLRLLGMQDLRSESSLEIQNLPGFSAVEIQSLEASRCLCPLESDLALEEISRESRAQNLHRLISAMREDEIREMSPAEKYGLETEMMEFMVRMRRHTALGAQST